MSFKASAPYNKSYSYILPMFGENFSQFDKIDKDKNPPSGSVLLNTYIQSEYKPEYKNHFFMEYKKSSHYEYYYERFLKEIDGFVDSYDTSFSTVFIYEIPFEKLNDYKMFRKSKYSKISDDYKRQILKFHNLNLHSRVGCVLYKHESLYKQREKELNLSITIDRNQEIGSLINLKKETHVYRTLKKGNTKIVQWG